MHLFSSAATLAVLAATCNSYAITGTMGGVNADTGERPFRQEISTFQGAGAAWDLYILAYQQFAQTTQSQQLSYYQVAGVHGRPYIAWDGVSGAYQAGYCTHGSILFPTWHRPYLSLFEQVIYNNAKSIAATYPSDKLSQYQAAANTLRVPYWDWARNATMPDVVSQPKITINAPSGAQIIDNPLYNYTFHPKPSTSDFPTSESSITKFPSTVRYPNAAGQSQPNLVNQQMQSNAAGLRSLVYTLFTSVTKYAEFSNTGYRDGRSGSYNSLENVHNYIHSFVGNGGHMSYVPYSAFDPIFWLHHTNIDRLFAIWQAANPSAGFTTSQANSGGTFTIRPGTVENVNTPLYPFHSNAANALYTSQNALTTRSFGYSYPEIVDWGVTSAQLSSNVKTTVNNLYGPNAPKRRRDLKDRRAALDAKTNYQYFVNIKFDSTQLTAPVQIHFFVGPVPQNSAAWATAPNLLGTFPALSHTDNTQVGQVSITDALDKARQILNLSPEKVIPILNKNLNYRVKNADGSVADNSIVPGLKIAIVGQSVVPAASPDQFPTYGPFIEYAEATQGVERGLRVGETM